jgi:CelD/BcsL family acetyltransferase involved in cellulose biosynthesis
MKVEVLAAGQLSAGLIANWRGIQQSNPALSSPFFCPEFTLSVASARDDVRIAAIEENGSLAAFFPFQMPRRRLGEPVGAPMSDYHGIVCAPNFRCNARALLKACGLNAWDFDHLVPGQAFFADFRWRVGRSPFIDLREGLAAYENGHRALGSSLIPEVKRKMKKMEREAGPVRFLFNTADDDAFQSLISWKRVQFPRLVFCRPWAATALSLIRTTDTPSFGGLVSVLYAGDTPVSVHCGMRSEKVLHWWLSAYDQEYGRFSPGSLLLYKILEAAPSMGLHTIDLGKGDALYKDRFKNGEIPVAEGSIAAGPVTQITRSLTRGAREAVRHTVLKSPARGLVYKLRESSLGGLFQ